MTQGNISKEVGMKISLKLEHLKSNRTLLVSSSLTDIFHVLN